MNEQEINYALNFLRVAKTDYPVMSEAVHNKVALLQAVNERDLANNTVAQLEARLKELENKGETPTDVKLAAVPKEEKK